MLKYLSTYSYIGQSDEENVEKNVYEGIKMVLELCSSCFISDIIISLPNV